MRLAAEPPYCCGRTPGGSAPRANVTTSAESLCAREIIPPRGLPEIASSPLAPRHDKTPSGAIVMVKGEPQVQEHSRENGNVGVRAGRGLRLGNKL